MTAADVAKGLSEREARFLEVVYFGRKPTVACRQEDKARQRLRRLGLVEVLRNPRRWSITPLGLAVRDVLEGE